MDAAYWQSVLPQMVFIGGTKRSGKDFVCDVLVEQAGFTKVHIVTAVRFINEMQLGMQVGALCVRVETSDETRRQRFLASGDDLALLNDPFEREVPLMPVHLEVSGEMEGWSYPYLLASGYESLLQYKRAA